MSTTIITQSGRRLSFSRSGVAGPKGWSPVFGAAVEGGTGRVVLQVDDWVGGAGTKPATGQYVGLDGLEADIADGVDVSAGAAAAVAAANAAAAGINTAVTGGLAQVAAAAVAAAAAAQAGITAAGAAATSTAAAAIVVARDAAIAAVAASGSIKSVATIAAMTALPAASLVDGQVCVVKAYSSATGGYGGGMFVWDAASTTATDGGVTFAADDLTAAGAPYTLAYGNVSSANASVTIHTQLVFGTVTLTYDNETKTLDSKWFHGHGVNPRNWTRAVPNNLGIIDHGTGKIYGDAFQRVGMLIVSNFNTHATFSLRHTTVNYRYCTGAGRWKRLVEGRTATPAWFGAKPQDATFDCSFAICWAMNWLVSQTDRVGLYYGGGPYWVYGMWGDVYSNIAQFGDGPRHCIVKYFGDLGGGTGGVIDLLKREYMGEVFIGGGTLKTIDPYRLLSLHQTGQVQADLSTGQSFANGYVDGNIANNLYFLADEGVETYWDFTLLSGVLRETPAYFGWFITNQSGRQYAANMKWYASKFGWINMGGSPHAAAGAGLLEGDTLEFGPSLSGRCLYGGQGKITGLTITGYTHSSFWAPYSGLFSNVVINCTGPNPWVSNANLNPIGIAHRAVSFEDDSGVTLADQRYGNRQCTINGLEIVWGAPSQASIRWVGEVFKVSGAVIHSPIQPLPHSLLNRDSGELAAGQGVATSGPVGRDITIKHRGLGGINVVSDGTYGLMSAGVVENVHIAETYASASLWGIYSHDMTNAVWTKSGLAATPVTYVVGVTDEHNRNVLCKVFEDTGNTAHYISRSITTTTAKAYVIDGEVTSGSLRDLYVWVQGIGYAFFDVSAETWGFKDAGWTSNADYLLNIPVLEPETGLYRFSIKFLESAGQTREVRIGLADGAVSAANATYTGDGTSYAICGALHCRPYSHLKFAQITLNTLHTSVADPGGHRNGDTFLPRRPASIALEARCALQAASGPYILQQDITFRNVKDETPKGYIGFFDNAETANVRPTRVLYDGCEFWPTTNKWFRTDLREGLALATDLVVRMVNTQVESFDPNITHTGGDADWQANIAKVIMKNCHTSDGRLSDFSQDIELTAVASSPTGPQVQTSVVNATGILLTTPLMWAPIAYSCEPVNAKARALAPAMAVEIVGGNYAAPRYRVTFSGTVANGDVIKLRLSGSVAPERNLLATYANGLMVAG